MQAIKKTLSGYIIKRTAFKNDSLKRNYTEPYSLC